MHLLLLVWLSLLLTGCPSSAEETERGCSTWDVSGKTDVCCSRCHPGNRLVYRCGLDPKALCTPCEDGTYLPPDDSLVPTCRPCNQCVGALILKKACTRTKDTECGCIAGFRCGDGSCTFCVTECGKGEEPTNKRSCQKCPAGTFNDQIHQKCKPWRTSCTHPGEHIEAMGDAVTDRKCNAVTDSIKTNNSTSNIVTMTTKKPGDGEGKTGLVIAVAVLLLVAVFLVTMIGTILNKVVKKKKKTPLLIIRPPTTDEPRTLETCSFHRPQQEQGSSSESLSSEESKTHLLV